MAATLTTLDAIMKELYTSDEVQNLIYKNHPLLQLLPKNTKAVGDNLPTPVIHSGSNRRSATIATAIAATGSSQSVKFNCTRVRDYGILSVANEALLAADGNMGSFVEGLKIESDSILMKVKNSLASALFRRSTGSIGRISTSADVSLTSFTLENIDDVVNFEVGDAIQLSGTDGGAVRDSGDELAITAVNRDTGVITVDTAISDVSAAAAGDYIVQSGDLNGKISGLADWIPLTAPGGTAFFGVDRSVDPVRLGGVRVDATDLQIKEALVKGAARLAREGGSPDVCVMNSSTWEALANSLGSQVNFVAPLKGGEVGFEQLIVRTANGPVKVIADPFCQSDRCYLLQMDTWELFSLGDVPHVFNRDGKFAREATADNYEVRLGYYANLRCFAPGWNAVIQLS